MEFFWKTLMILLYLNESLSFISKLKQPAPENFRSFFFCKVIYNNRSCREYNSLIILAWYEIIINIISLISIVLFYNKDFIYISRVRKLYISSMLFNHPKIIYLFILLVRFNNNFPRINFWGRILQKL